jgi:hypothetical protein
MWGTVLTTLVIFLILLVVTRAAGFFRGRWSVAGAETSGTQDVGTSAAIGISSGIAVLILLFLLYLGLTRWDWAGSPVGGAHPVTTPVPISRPASRPANPTAPSAATTASPSASPSR